MVRGAGVRKRGAVARCTRRRAGCRGGRGHQGAGVHQRWRGIRQPTVVQAWRAEAAAHQQGHRTKHQTESQQAHQSTWAALRATGTVAIPTGESTADSPSADCIRDSEVRRYGGSGNAERRRDGTQPTPGKRPDGRSSRWLSAGTGMAVREAWCSPAQSGDVVPQHTDLRPVRWASQRTHRPVGAVVSLPPMRLAV